MKLDLELKSIADKLGVTIYEILELLDSHGVHILDPNKALDNRQKEKIEKIIQKQNQFKYYVENYKIFIDTCSLMDTNIYKFYNNIHLLLKATSSKIIVPYSVIYELKNHSKSKNKDKQNKADNGIQILEKLKHNNLLDVRGESNDNFADNVFLVVFTKFRMQHNLLLITQDNILAKEILNLNNSIAVKANNVLVKKINEYGYLSNVENIQGYEQKRIEKIDKFKLSSEVKRHNDKNIKISTVPNENDIITSGTGLKIKLVKKLGSGGEGSVYTTNTEYVAKIYEKDKVNISKFKKIKLMVSKQINYKGICWPVDILYNNNNEFVGYLMHKANGKEMKRLFLARHVLLKNMPNWKKRDTVELCITILDKINYLHKRNIILGDINDFNILIVSSKEVYFVDTDSYQIEGYPCPVGTDDFTPPEIILDNNEYKNKYKVDRKFSDYLRTFENEYFSISVLLFMIMLLGKHPYSLKGGEDMKKNILNMEFAYPLGKKSNGKTPVGKWKFMWSHMPYFIKEAFYETFIKGGKFSKPQDRIDVETWTEKMKEYLRLLDSGEYAKQDEMSEDLLPTRRKKVKGIEYEKCILCGSEEVKDSLKSGICNECLKKGEIYKCNNCGKEMVLTNYQKYIKNKKKYDICMDCFRKRNHYNLYTNTNTDNKSNLVVPTRLSGCFITTAICEYFDKEDDCYELTTLRKFRDNWLKNQYDGIYLIEEYYDIAPNLVERLNSLSIKDNVYHKLWYEYINICLKMIEEEKYQECKLKYIEMVNYLKKYLTN